MHEFNERRLRAALKTVQDNRVAHKGSANPNVGDSQERALGAGNTDEGKAKKIERARKPKLAKQ